MTTDERFRRMDAARVRAELSVQDLWLRYLALGGTGDAFDLDGYLQGLVPLDTFQQDVLAQTLNESLEDAYRAYRVPLSRRPLDDLGDDRLGRLGRLINELLDEQLPAAPDPAAPEPPDRGPA
jgi:hypothetical protein